MLKLLFGFVIALSISSCSQGLNEGNIEKNLKATDKIYGRCNNPNRQFTLIEKEICIAKERAAGPDGEVGDPLNLTEIIDKFNNPDKNVVYGGLSVNEFLWNGSLSVLGAYPLNTVDSQGGFISTEWILDKDELNKRCQIKINITSQEFVSTGVETKILCQKKDGDEWYSEKEILFEEEKKITLKILEKAQELSIAKDLS
jgi:hypothetical protein